MVINIHKHLKFKNSINMKYIIIFLLVTLFTTSIYSQAPQAFNYQGVARDLSGTPISNQTIGLQIAIIKGSTNGTEVYKETHNTTTTDLGLFNLQIGTGTVENGNFEDIDWGNDSHFLQIEMDENGGSNYQLIGTSELLSVPFALYAENGSKWEEFGSIFTTNSGFPIFQDGIEYSFDKTKFEFGQSYEQSTDRTTPQFSIFQDSMTFYSVVLVNRDVYDNIPTLEFVTDKNQGVVRNFSFRTDGTSKLFIKGDGNVGINTTTPKSKLQITDGDIYIENVQRGVIMTSPNGTCWRYTPDDSGQLIATSINCPN